MTCDMCDMCDIYRRVCVSACVRHFDPRGPLSLQPLHGFAIMLRSCSGSPYKSPTFRVYVGNKLKTRCSASTYGTDATYGTLDEGLVLRIP